MNLFRLEGTLWLRLSLPVRALRVPAGLGWREMRHKEVRRLSLSLSQDATELDQAAPAGWRAFALLEGDTLVHHCFIEARPEGPLLFRAWTVPEARRRGFFRLAITLLGTRLSEEGARHLDSSTDRLNTASLRAHRAAGFHVRRRVLRPIVLGVDVRRMAARVLSRRA